MSVSFSLKCFFFDLTTEISSFLDFNGMLLLFFLPTYLFQFVVTIKRDWNYIFTTVYSGDLQREPKYFLGPGAILRYLKLTYRRSLTSKCESETNV